jgi:hypothetical protein
VLNSGVLYIYIFVVYIENQKIFFRKIEVASPSAWAMTLGKWVFNKQQLTSFPECLSLALGEDGFNSSAEMSSRYWSGKFPEGPGVSLVVMKTCRSGEPRLESLVATFVGVCSPAGASGVPSWKGSESR